MKTIEDILVVRRTYRHPRELVYRAWTEPKRLNAWFTPPNARTETTVDLRIGGKFTFNFYHEDGHITTGGGVYTHIDRPELLGFTWGWLEEGATKDDSHVTVEFHAVSGGTEVVVKHEGLTGEAAELHLQGWNGGLDALETYLLENPIVMPAGPGDLVSAAAAIQQSKIGAERALARLKDTFDHVPDDKLHYTPAKSAKSAFSIYIHTNFSTRHFAAILRGDPSGDRGREEVVAEANRLEASIKTRADADEIFERSRQEALAAIESLTPARVMADERVAFVLTLFGRHADSHAAQIDYLQTTWGDLEDHLGH